jgi:uncharacterized protein (TIGR03437 family)
MLYGSYNGALVLSSNGGNAWIPMFVTAAGLPQPPVTGLIIDPNTGALYLATTTAAGAMWRSLDGGNTWTNANAGLPTNLGDIDFFNEIAGTPSTLFAKFGSQLFTSVDGANTWRLNGVLPGPSSTFQIADYTPTTMYYLDSVNLLTYQSLDGGHAWSPVGSVDGLGPPNYFAIALGLLYAPEGYLYASINGYGPSVGGYLSTGGGASFTNESSVGLGVFTKMYAGASGPTYAVASGTSGFYRSEDAGQSWQSIGVSFGTLYTLNAIDPNSRTSIYGQRVVASPAFVHSIDGGDTWTVISSTVTPSLAKPAAQINVTLEQGAPYSQAFTVRTFEDPSWALAATLSTTGESWLSLGATGGTTPFANSLTISTAGLTPGMYQSTITISAPQSFNKSVTIPVQLTVKPLGSLGPQFQTSTIAGNGNATTVLTSGSATSIGIGAPVALNSPSAGGLVISSGNRIWQYANSALTLLAGNGTFGSSGDGADAATATLANPEAIAFDQQGALYFTEYSVAKVRKILNGAITTTVDFSKFPPVQGGSHGMLFDSSGRILLANTQGLLRYDGSKLTIVTPYTMTDPFGMAADALGNIYVSDRGANEIVEFTAAGTVSVIAGLGSPGFGGDGGPAIQASLNTPSGLAIDSTGTLYIADAGNQRIRTITTDGMMHTVAGSGVSAFAGDGTTADFAEFSNPSAVWVDALANLYVADTGNNRIRKLTLQTNSGPVLAGVLSAASGSATLSPGEIFALYGSSLASAPVSETAPSWPTLLGGVSITINGVGAPLYFVMPGLVGGQVPYETATGTATASVTVNGSLPVQTTFQVATTSPALFVAADGKHVVAVNYSDGSLNAAEPSPPGTLVILYLTGMGLPSVPVATGAPSPSTPPFGSVNYPYSITINGQPVQNVPYLGLAPGYPGLVQANIIVPSLPPGDYPLVVTINGVASNSQVFSIGQ